MTRQSLEELTRRILEAPRAARRRLVALAGPPASGKSTLAELLAKSLSEQGCPTQVVPMDGFHLHNPTLVSRNLLHRKGAPETFDAAGFVHLIKRLQTDDEVFYPTFDRERDIAIAGAGLVDTSCDTAIVEGNYLLFDAPPWRELAGCWDLSIQLDTPLAVLQERLVARWLAHGLSPEQALERATSNDLANAQRVMDAALPADVIY